MFVVLCLILSYLLSAWCCKEWLKCNLDQWLLVKCLRWNVRRLRVKILCECKTLKPNTRSLKNTANWIIRLLLLSFEKLLQTKSLLSGCFLWLNDLGQLFPKTLSCSKPSPCLCAAVVFHPRALGSSRRRCLSAFCSWRPLCLQLHSRHLVFTVLGSQTKCGGRMSHTCGICSCWQAGPAAFICLFLESFCCSYIFVLSNI